MRRDEAFLAARGGQKTSWQLRRSNRICEISTHTRVTMLTQLVEESRVERERKEHFSLSIIHQIRLHRISMVELAPAGTRLGASDGGLPLSDCESVSKPRACCLLFHRDRRETYYSWRLFIPLPIPTTVIVTAVHIIADGGRISNARQSLRASNVAVRCRLLFRVERDRTLD